VLVSLGSKVRDGIVGRILVGYFYCEHKKVKSISQILYLWYTPSRLTIKTCWCILIQSPFLRGRVFPHKFPLFLRLSILFFFQVQYWSHLSTLLPSINLPLQGIRRATFPSSSTRSVTDVPQLFFLSPSNLCFLFQISVTGCAVEDPWFCSSPELIIPKGANPIFLFLNCVSEVFFSSILASDRSWHVCACSLPGRSRDC